MKTIPSYSIIKNIFLGCIFTLIQFSKPLAFSQTGCDPSVPTYIVDLTGQPNGTYISPPDIRNGNCCGTMAPDQCIQFILTLDSMSNGIVFSIASGAVPPGAIFYQVDCGPPTPVGNMLCLSGVGPHYITFCKPGNNSNQYQITALAQPQSGPDVTATTGCSQPLYVDGLDAPSTTWTSVFPGPAGAYNSYLSCTSGCDSVIVTPGAGAPAYIDYLVCGYVYGGCFPFTYCDTLRVNINQDLTALNTDVTCFGQNNGSINLTVPGTTGVSYLWSNGSTTEDISGLAAGSYSVTVTDATGCTRTLSTTITQPPLLNVINASNMVTCYGGSDGSIDITVSGGTGSILYSWSNGSTSEDISGVSAGNYTVSITDANGCTSSFSGNVSQPLAPLSITGIPTSILCFGNATGAIDITPSGGTPGYTYLWNTGAVTEDITGLISGSYNVTATDLNGCTATFSTVLNQPSAPLVINGLTTDVLCFGGSTGAVDINISGGTPGYSYLWNNGSVSQDINLLSAGNYSVTVTDANNCSVTYTSTVNQPIAPLSVSTIPTHVLCFGGTTGAIDLNANGGTPGYTYLWTNGIITQDLSSLTAGSYSVTVTDANGCTISSSSTVNEPSAPLNVMGVTSPVLCYGNATGAIDITITGGSPGYIYLWSNGATSQDLTGLNAGTYSVMVTDANGCTNNSFLSTVNEPSQPLAIAVTQTDILCFGGATGAIDITPSGGTAGYSYLWSTSAVTQDISGLISGMYDVTVSDINGCTSIQSITLNQPLAPLSISGTSTNVLCFGGATGAINISVSGGTPGYSYTWNTGATTEDIYGLIAGSYSVIITDANGCTNTSYSSTITQPALALDVNGSSTNVVCYGGATGSVDITVSGGTPGYSYNWSNGSVGEDLSGLSAGTYSVLITDANGCTNTSFTSSVSQPLALLVSGNLVDPTCTGFINGNITVDPSGGTSPYTFGWNTGSADKDLFGIGAGAYTVVVTDANGCTVSGNWSLLNPPVLNITPVVSPILCYGSNTGNINLNVNGGTLPYNILWNTGSTMPSLSSLAPGNYSVTVTDSKGCTITDSYSLVYPPELQVNLDSLHTIWLGESATLEAIPNGGTGTYIYNWTPDNNLTCSDCSTTEASPFNNTAYTVTVTDANGCTANAGAYIDVLFVMYVPNSFTPNGDNDNDVFLAVSESVKDFTMRIFDRWGEEIFTSSSINEGWNGTFKQSEAKQDVYVYRIEATFLNGVHRELIGQVNLLR